MNTHSQANNAPLTDRINAEPAILRGLSSTETLFAIGLAFAFWVPVALLIGILVGHMQTSVIFMGAGPIFSVWLLSGWFQKIKRDRPDYYYQHMFKKQLTNMGLLSSRFLTHSELWDLGRSLPAMRSSRSIKFIRARGKG